MKTELVDVSPTRKEIKIEIEPEVVRETFDRISDRYAKQAMCRVSAADMHRARSCARASRVRFAAKCCASWYPTRSTMRSKNMNWQRLANRMFTSTLTRLFRGIGEDPISFHVDVEVLPEG